MPGKLATNGAGPVPEGIRVVDVDAAVAPGELADVVEPVVQLAAANAKSASVVAILRQSCLTVSLP